MINDFVTNIHYLFNVLEALNFDDPEAWHMQLSSSVWVNLYVQLLSVFTQQVSEKKYITDDERILKALD